MIIRVGSENPVKVYAVQEYFPMKFVVESVATDSGVDEQPKSLGETIEGAKNRSRCREDADWGIGIESGIMPVEIDSGIEDSGWMNIVICSIWDGKKFGIGMASGFVVPPSVVDIVFRDEIDLSEAFFRVGMTKEKRIGYQEGIIHKLTNELMDRKEYIKQAITMAKIQMDHSELYG